MTTTTVYECPYKNPEGCAWTYQEPPLGIQIVSLGVHRSVVEQALGAHLNDAHDGWTMEELLARQLVRGLRT